MTRSPRDTFSNTGLGMPQLNRGPAGDCPAPSAPTFTVTVAPGAITASAGNVKRRRPESRRYQPPSATALTGSWFLIFTHSPEGLAVSSPSASQFTHSFSGDAALGPTPQASASKSPR